MRHFSFIVGTEAIGDEIGGKPVVQHPCYDAARIGRELQLQQFLPHLFLAAPKAEEIACKAPRKRKKLAAEDKDFVQGPTDHAAMADQVAQIDDLVARQNTLAKCLVKGLELPRLSMDRSNGPDPAGRSQEPELLPVGGHEPRVYLLKG